MILIAATVLFWGFLNNTYDSELNMEGRNIMVISCHIERDFNLKNLGSTVKGIVYLTSLCLDKSYYFFMSLYVSHSIGNQNIFWQCMTGFEKQNHSTCEANPKWD